MNKLLMLSLFLYGVAAVRPFKGNYDDAVKTINDDLERKSKKNGTMNDKPFNLRENINYERKNNYELYTDIDGELKQQKFNVNEPRQILKKNIDEFRYLINDLEILFGVYKFNPRDKEKVLKETLKPESLCFTIMGLISNHLNELKVNNAPIYGLYIKGERNSNYEVNSTLGIYAILSNITISIGNFTFPEMKNAPYQLPYLVGHYDSRTGFKNKDIAYLCPLPKFLIDVIRTTQFGLRVFYNGADIDVKELFPITLSYALENKSLLPIYKEDSNYKAEKTKLLNILSKEAEDIPFRMIKDKSISGKGIKNPEERLLVSKSFFNSREQIKKFISSSGKTPMDSNSIALYFLALSQNAFSKQKNFAMSRITKINVTNIQKSKNGYLSQYSIQLGLENNSSITINAVVNGKNIYVPSILEKNSSIITSGSPSISFETIPYSYGIYVNEGVSGLVYIFADLVFNFNKAFPYNVNNLSMFVSSK
ncbi:secreted ookinete protein, putative [Plasmodium berghei]|uniref:Secreted ookinete protein, putative n=2 Tax=Plasmodium berghei TaxID=5821 RepID=A0A509AHA6_PLABA|nr:common gametocyte gene 1, putative [Plasmodium berghei ANKA]CXI19952.1 secreted ookinete protein, putative [Plasmodium berghei]SCM19895.1 secreted ookinete protein, putative [Plasmodium berghei]SCN23617.1 secreted ookinete protein, putative [Plasmodium berghei]SCO59179.1 secreted ookinete protein, putative [Plasmodium berghei]SCO59988.1 secreted ookinete protein, putative [Plasmodium berghei]|eukprot:XP_034420692.1 common gametocyte gene 1, putative [Plasmodium berghei ANKA]